MTGLPRLDAPHAIASTTAILASSTAFTADLAPPRPPRRHPAYNTATTLASSLPDAIAVPAPWDPLAAPSVETMEAAALTIWPTGPAWGSPDGEAVDPGSWIARTTRALLVVFADLHARAFTLAREATLSGIDQTLDDWEADYGLPDNCVTGETTMAERIRALEAKVAAIASITPGDFIRLAWRYGFSIEIEEPAMFRCGFSECGGEHTVGDARQEVYWIVRLEDLAVDYFRVGESQCGRDRLFDYGDAERLLCILRRAAPAWTIPVLE